jgi:hypothetical protein
MKFTTAVLSILSIALAASAAPSPIDARNGGEPANPSSETSTCNNDGGKQVCCGVGIFCNILTIGQTCNGGDSYCCQTNQVCSSLV